MGPPEAKIIFKKCFILIWPAYCFGFKLSSRLSVVVLIIERKPDLARAHAGKASFNHLTNVTDTVSDISGITVSIALA